jgi:phytoene dehydrogenase-like protein
MTRPDAIIVGAGHNGLVCAAYLARAGHDVLVLEANDAVGGMAAPRNVGGAYHFPGLPHAVTPLARVIRDDLKLDRLGYKAGPAVDTIALDAEGAHLTLGPNRASGDGLSGADAAAWPGFRKRYLAFAKALQPLFENKPPRLKNMPFADKAALAKLGWNIRFGLGRETMYEFLRVAAINIYDVLNDTFDDERLKAAVALDAVLGSAMGPRTPGTVLTWLQRLHGELGGPPTIHCADLLINALARSAEDAGSTIRCNARVARILVEDDKASGVELDGGETIESSLVVSNADPRLTLSSLIDARQLDTMFANRVAQIRGSGVVAKLHLALSGLPKFEGLDASQAANRLLIAPSMRHIERAFNHSKYGEYSDEPVLEISIPSVHNGALAPEGHHVMSVNVAFMPYDLEGGWTEQKTTAAEKVIARIGRYAPGLESLIVSYEFLTPADIEAQFGSVQGHWHHGELSIHQSFMMRPLHGAAQYDTPVGGLFLCGAGCHPGGGLTGLPGRNAARRILELGGAN